MIDIKSFNKVLRLTRVKKYVDKDNHGKWKLFFDSELHDFGGLSLRVTPFVKIYAYISDVFTPEILKIWSEISYEDNITSVENLLSLPLWQNSLVRIENKLI